MSLSLVVMAAGLGSRFGGCKQMEPIGPNHEWLLEYSIYDAIQAGFSRIIFVINSKIQKEFESYIRSRLRDKVEIRIVVQEKPDYRQKPWGTGHAVLCARKYIEDSFFCVINADDFYGQKSYQYATEFFKNRKADQFCSIGYSLRNTLSTHGSVSRGICKVDGTSYLKSIEEYTDIHIEESGQIIGRSFNERVENLSGEEIVSMNFWGFGKGFLSALESEFKNFLQKTKNKTAGEFYLPHAVANIQKEINAATKVIQIRDSWFGMTYREDLEMTKEALSQLKSKGVYPENLWR